MICEGLTLGFLWIGSIKPSAKEVRPIKFIRIPKSEAVAPVSPEKSADCLCSVERAEGTQQKRGIVSLEPAKLDSVLSSCQEMNNREFERDGRALHYIRCSPLSRTSGKAKTKAKVNTQRSKSQQKYVPKIVNMRPSYRKLAK